jgi:murein DD-endopeptidase MepM/ murein hydrolase activator NlpD
MTKLVTVVLSAVLGFPLLVAAALGGTASTAPVAVAGVPDERQVAAAPATLRSAFVAAARRVVLPPALLVATVEASPGLAAASPEVVAATADRLLAAGRLPGGAWDATRALHGIGLASRAREVLAAAARYGYAYRPDRPPLDRTRYRFPVAGRASYGPGHHDYPATDVFAAVGTPLAACVRAEVLALRPVEYGKGGITITLRGEDGFRYYYAHLVALHPGLRVGQVVEAGQLVGWSGRTGNARTTPPHLHFGISKTGSVAGEIDTYPYLRAWEGR